MVTGFKLIPNWLLWPSYRTFMMLTVWIFSIPLAFTYISISRWLDYLHSLKQKAI